MESLLRKEITMQKLRVVPDFTVRDQDDMVIPTLKVADNGTATVQTRLIYSSGAIGITKDVSDNEVKKDPIVFTFDEKLINNIHHYYEKDIKKRRISLSTLPFGERVYPPVFLIHEENAYKVVGRMEGSLKKVREEIEGKNVLSLYATMLIHDTSIINDLVENGRNSPFSSSSVGISFIGDGTDIPFIRENSITPKPKMKHSVFLSEDIEVMSDDEEYLSKAQSIKDYMIKMSERNKILQNIEDIGKKKKILENKILMSRLLNEQIFKNKITRADKIAMMSEMEYMDDEIKIVEKVFKHITPSRINIGRSFTGNGFKTDKS
jgi:hypothetical protein